MSLGLPHFPHHDECLIQCKRTLHRQHTWVIYIEHNEYASFASLREIQAQCERKKNLNFVSPLGSKGLAELDE